MDVTQFIQNGTLCIKVKPNAPKSKVLKWDGSHLKVAIAAVPDKGKANKEVIKFFSKLTGKKVEIIKGLKSREKVLVFEAK